MLKENEIEEKIDKIIESFLDKILELIKTDNDNKWKLINNNIKSFHTMMKIRGQIHRAYRKRQSVVEDISPLLLFSLLNKKALNGTTNDKLITKIKELMKFEASLE